MMIWQLCASCTPHCWETGSSPRRREKVLVAAADDNDVHVWIQLKVLILLSEKKKEKVTGQHKLQIEKYNSQPSLSLTHAHTLFFFLSLHFIISHMYITSFPILTSVLFYRFPTLWNLLSLSYAPCDCWTPNIQISILFIAFEILVYITL